MQERFWNSEYTDSAVSYPSDESSTVENVASLLQILQDTSYTVQLSSPHTFNHLSNLQDPILQNYGYDVSNFNWNNLMPAPVTPLIISANSDSIQG